MKIDAKFKPVKNFTEKLTVTNRSKNLNFSIDLKPLTVFTGNEKLVADTLSIIRTIRTVYYPLFLLYKANAEETENIHYINVIKNVLEQAMQSISWPEITDKGTVFSYTTNGNTLTIELEDQETCQEKYTNEKNAIGIKVDFDITNFNDAIYAIGFGNIPVSNKLIESSFEWSTAGLYTKLDNININSLGSDIDIRLDNCIRFYNCNQVEGSADPLSQMHWFKYFVDEWLNREKDEITSLIHIGTQSPYILGTIKEMVIASTLNNADLALYDFSAITQCEKLLAEDIITYDVFKYTRELENKIKSLIHKSSV